MHQIFLPRGFPVPHTGAPNTDWTAALPSLQCEGLATDGSGTAPTSWWLPVAASGLGAGAAGMDTSSVLLLGNTTVADRVGHARGPSCPCCVQ